MIKGIGNYSAYAKLFSGMYSYGGASKKNTANDLQALMKRVDEVRSPAYQKKIKEQFKNGSADLDLNNDEVGTVSSEMKLGDTAKGLRKSAAELSSMSLTDISNKDELVKKVNAFAESYNSTIDAMGKSDSVDALRTGVSMTNAVKTYSGAFSRMGIKVGSDNKLTVDEKALRAADDNAVASMVKSSYSPISRIADKAEDISKAAVNKAQTTSFKNMMYGQSSDNNSLFGGYNSAYNSIVNSFVGTFFDSYM